MATRISCEAEHCRNLAKYAVSDYPIIGTEPNTFAACGIHLLTAFKTLNPKFPLYLVGEIDNYGKR